MLGAVSRAWPCNPALDSESRKYIAGPRSGTEYHTHLLNAGFCLADWVVEFWHAPFQPSSPSTGLSGLFIPSFLVPTEQAQDLYNFSDRKLYPLPLVFSKVGVIFLRH